MAIGSHGKLLSEERGRDRLGSHWLLQVQGGRWIRERCDRRQEGQSLSGVTRPNPSPRCPLPFGTSFFLGHPAKSFGAETQARALDVGGYKKTTSQNTMSGLLQSSLHWGKQMLNKSLHNYQHTHLRGAVVKEDPCARLRHLQGTRTFQQRPAAPLGSMQSHGQHGPGDD